MKNDTWYRRTVYWFRKRIQSGWNAIRPGKNAWKGAAWGLLILSIILWFIACFSLVTPNSVWWVAPAMFIAGILVSLVIGTLVFLLLKWIQHWLPFYRWAFLVAVLLSGIAFVFFGSFKLVLPLGISVVIFVSTFLGAAIWILLHGQWEHLNIPRKVIYILGSFIGLAGLVFCIWWLSMPGSEGPQVINASLMGETFVEPIPLPDPSQPGKYSVATLTYGSGEDLRRQEFGNEVDLHSRSVNASPFINGWKGFSGWFLKLYWGFDLQNFPLNGRVWYPQGDGPFPLILVVHGNHMQEDFSDPGYGYLGELLASRGMIVVSVDENFLNGTWVSVFGADESKNENDARAWMLLEHLRQWKQWNNEPGNPFYQKVNWEKLALIGHSRGGEAVAEAANFNRLPAYPDNALVKFSYNYPIQAVIAIAPVDDQYNPAGTATPMEDVNYLVIQGSMDGDLTSFDGVGQYNRVSFNAESDHFKSSVYIHGANHGQFNSTWGRIDSGTHLSGVFLNLTPILPVEDQEQIAKVLISAFLEASINDQSGYRQLFRDWRSASSWLPETVYLTQYEDSSFEPIVSYEEDINPETTTIEGGHLSSSNLNTWYEGVMNGRWDQSLSTSVVTLAWDNRETNARPGSYSINLPNGDFQPDDNTYLVINLADSGKDPDPSKANDSPINQEGLNLTVEIQSGKELARVPLSDYSLLQPCIQVQIAKSAFMSDLPDCEPVMQTFFIPLADFVKANPDIVLENLNAVRLRFDQSAYGTILVDNIGFWRP